MGVLLLYTRLLQWWKINRYFNSEQGIQYSRRVTVTMYNVYVYIYMYKSNYQFIQAVPDTSLFDFDIKSIQKLYTIYTAPLLLLLKDWTSGFMDSSIQR